MKQQAAAIEYFHIVRELQELVGGRIDKVYQDEGFFLFPIYTGTRRTNLAVDLPNAVYLTENKPSFGKPKGFCMFLRKRLQKGRITAIKQIRFDRIIKLTIEVFDNTYHVYLELFGKGNLLVCDQDDKIISAYDNIVYKDRSLRGGVVYELPTAQADTAKLSFEEFAQLVEGNDVEKTLATTLGLGGEYAGIVAAETLQETYNNLQQLLTTITPVYNDTGAYLVGEGTRTDTFSQALAALLDPQRAQEKKEAKLDTVSRAHNKLEVRLKAQEKQIKKMEKQSAEEQRKGEILYEKYQEIARLLSQAQHDRKALSEEAFRTKYESLPYVVQADKQQFEIEVPE